MVCAIWENSGCGRKRCWWRWKGVSSWENTGSCDDWVISHCFICSYCGSTIFDVFSFPSSSEAEKVGMLLHQICVLSLLGAIASYMNILQFGKLPCLKTQANQHSCPRVPFPQQNKFIGTSPLGTLLSGDLKIGGRTMFLQSLYLLPL